MTCYEKQIRKLMEYAKTMTEAAAAAKAGVSLRTARNYIKTGGKMAEAKEWKWRQTHKDVFADVWPQIEKMLITNPGLQSQTLMQWVIDQFPDQFKWSHLRTLQRRVSKWRALKGPDLEVMFPQIHIAGKQSQS